MKTYKGTRSENGYGWRKCPVCVGSGRMNEHSETPCPTCKGEGHIEPDTEDESGDPRTAEDMELEAEAEFAAPGDAGAIVMKDGKPAGIIFAGAESGQVVALPGDAIKFTDEGGADETEISEEGKREIERRWAERKQGGRTWTPETTKGTK